MTLSSGALLTLLAAAELEPGKASAAHSVCPADGCPAALPNSLTGLGSGGSSAGMSASSNKGGSG